MEPFEHGMVQTEDQVTSISNGIAEITDQIALGTDVHGIPIERIFRWPHRVTFVMLRSTRDDLSILLSEERLTLLVKTTYLKRIIGENSSSMIRLTWHPMQQRDRPIHSDLNRREIRLETVRSKSIEPKSSARNCRAKSA